MTKQSHINEEIAMLRSRVKLGGFIGLRRVRHAHH